METGLYFHIPFCKKRCGYCDFVTFAGFDRLIPMYVEALKKQVSLVGNGELVRSIFFGGGTPSLIPPDSYESIFKHIHQYFDVTEKAEITIEANPGTVESIKLAEYRKAGFNRISFGMQSANVNELQLLDRLHHPGEVEQAVAWARNAGFENINLDLIFGLPGQTLDDWKYSLLKALKLSPQHLSVYSLIVEEGTPLEKKIKAGVLKEPEEEVVAEQYEWTCATLEKAGYEHYEISNWALTLKDSDFRCQHNLRYWRLRSYHGFGCGAVGFISTEIASGNPSLLMQNPAWINQYIQLVDQAYSKLDVNCFFKPVSSKYEMETRLFVGFRLLEEGIDPREFSLRYGVSVETAFGDKLRNLLSEGYLEITKNGYYRLTRNTWLLANRVFREFASIEA